MLSSEVKTPISGLLNTMVRWAIVIALSVLLISMATGQAGITNYMELQKNKEELLAATIAIRVENQNLEEKIRLLKTSKEQQIRFLKSELNYIEPNEYVYLFTKNAASKRTPSQAIQATSSLKKPRG